jgi:hypothetical protein
MTWAVKIIIEMTTLAFKKECNETKKKKENRNNEVYTVLVPGISVKKYPKTKVSNQHIVSHPVMPR